MSEPTTAAEVAASESDGIRRVGSPDYHAGYAAGRKESCEESLRDQFAMAALTGMCGVKEGWAGVHSPERLKVVSEAMAIAAYVIAEDCLAERRKRHKEGQ